ncbi:helix-turn-helix transcriptional regulator, partial [Serratia marcescens]|nr:helix-turn-helix transcriptional regulator [Serratia marcescens]
MHLWRQQPLNIAIMDRCPLTLEGLASFLKTLPTQAKVVVKETSVRAVADSVVYQQADVLITEMDG